MQSLKRTRYYTMNSWNLSTSLAYNLKVYNVINRDLQDKVHEIMECEDFYDEINTLIHVFDVEHDHQWQAGFNGHSGGYLVLYQGGKNENGGVYTQPGLEISNDEVPADVKKAFRQLAIDIVKSVEYAAKNYSVIDEEYTITKTKKVMA